EPWSRSNAPAGLRPRRPRACCWPNAPSICSACGRGGGLVHGPRSARAASLLGRTPARRSPQEVFPMRTSLLASTFALAWLSAPAVAQDLLVYDNQLRSGFEDWSWAT